MKPENFDEKKFQKLFKDDKLSPEQQLIKYGYISGWLSGLFADKTVYENYKKGGKNFQDAYMEILEDDFKKFREKAGF
jgi:hypothetical protein